MAINRNTPFEPTRRISLPINDNFAKHFAKLLADITINWGRIEHSMFTLIFFMDEKRGAELSKIFFQSTSLFAREKILTRQIKAVMRNTHPTFLSSLKAALDAFQNVRERRNILVHGLWEPAGSSSFKVRPLRLDKLSGDLEKPIKVDLAYVASLNREIDFILQKLASLGAEMIAHQALEKIKKRKSR